MEFVENEIKIINIHEESLACSLPILTAGELIKVSLVDQIRVFLMHLMQC